jgi:hypothetical protein
MKLFDIDTLNSLLFEVFKVPISILGVTITIVAIMTVLHRSSQISVQIKLSTEQNDFANYYKHLEEFERFINENKLLSKAYNIHSIKSLHRKVWPNFKNGDYSISVQHLNYVKFLFGKMITELYEVPDIIESQRSPLSIIQQSRLDLERCYFLKREIKIESEELLFTGHVLPCIQLANDICQILSFEYDIHSDETFSKILLLSETRSINGHSDISRDVKSWLKNPQESIISTLSVGAIGTISFAYDEN